jgi:amino-acid N-acetyltransferase
VLAAAGLPLDGAADAFATGVVAFDSERLVGCAAIESHGGAALLRSVAVVPDRRRSGLGAGLVRAAEDLARGAGASEAILLTDTAESWFARLGYATIERSSVPVEVSRSVEFQSACASTAVAMRRRLV